jgi:hypothetical protein
VLDFAGNDVYGRCAARGTVLHREPGSENLFRCVAARRGTQCDQGNSQERHSPAAVTAWSGDDVSRNRGDDVPSSWFIRVHVESPYRWQDEPEREL